MAHMSELSDEILNAKWTVFLGEHELGDATGAYSEYSVVQAAIQQLMDYGMWFPKLQDLSLRGKWRVVKTEV